MPRGGAHKAASIRDVATSSVSIQSMFHCMKIGVFLPYLDRAAYTVEMEGIRIVGGRLNISQLIFRADSCGASQTMIDSSTEFVFLVEDAYIKVSEEVARMVGPTKLKCTGCVHRHGGDRTAGWGDGVRDGMWGGVCGRGARVGLGRGWGHMPEHGSSIISINKICG